MRPKSAGARAASLDKAGASGFFSAPWSPTVSLISLQIPGPDLAAAWFGAREAWAALLAGAAVAGALWWRNHARQTRALRESEERFRELFENAIDGIYQNPPEGGFRRVNPAMARILGYPSVEALTRITPEQTAGIYVSPTRREEFFRLLGERDHVTDFESEIWRPDGTTAWIKENVRAVRGADGKLLYLQGFVSDITARKRAELDLRRSEERYRVLFEHSPLGILEYDYRSTLAWLDRLKAGGVADFEAWCDANPEELRREALAVKIVGANQATMRLFGATSLEDGLRRLPQIFTPEALAARRRTFRALWDGRNDCEGEFALRSLDGAEKRAYFHWWAPVIEGRPYYERTQLVLVDLTEMTRARQALAAERERLSVTLRAMSDAIVTVDRDGRVQYLNEAATELTGWPREEATGRTLLEICQFGSAQAGQPIAAPMAAALAQGRAVDLPPHTLLQPRRGERRRVEGRCAPMHDLQGQAIGVVLAMRDVTQRSRLEADLLRASKMESIGVLAGGIAHDFNNLLAIVMGNLTLALLDDRVREAGGKWLREAERGTLRAKELTQQLLTFAKGGEPVRSAVLLADAVREAAEFALHGAAARCEFAIADDLRAADADKGQIGQVVQNLVINAVQAMPGGGTIRLSLANETLAAGAVATLPAGHYLRLEIADTGRGIAPEHLARIFEPFFTTKEYGTGLGLATVYSVIQKHRGYISVESTVGRGSTFRLWLPAARAEPPKPAATANPFDRVKGRVLFMDDEEPIREMSRELLERQGLEVTLTNDGGAAVREYAIAQISGRRFDLVIVDLTVPGGMGGADAMREILKIDPSARGIVSSGYSSDPVMGNYRVHGFRGSVPKPYRIGDFSQTIRRVLTEE